MQGLALLGLDRYPVFPVVHVVAPWRCEDVGLGWTLSTLLNPTCPPAWFSVGWPPCLRCLPLFPPPFFLSFPLFPSISFACFPFRRVAGWRRPPCVFGLPALAVDGSFLFYTSLGHSGAKQPRRSLSGFRAFQCAVLCLRFLPDDGIGGAGIRTLCLVHSLRRFLHGW